MKVIQSLLCGLILMNPIIHAGDNRSSQPGVGQALGFLVDYGMSTLRQSNLGSYAKSGAKTFGYLAGGAVALGIGALTYLYIKDNLKKRFFEKILVAIQQHDEHYVQEYINQGNPIMHGYHAWDYDKSPLRAAVRSGNKNIVSMMVNSPQCEREKNDRDISGFCGRYLEESIKEGHLDIFKLLLQHRFLNVHTCHSITQLALGKDQFFEALMPSLTTMWHEYQSSSNMMPLCHHVADNPSPTNLDHFKQYITQYWATQKKENLAQIVGDLITATLDFAIKEDKNFYSNRPNDKNKYLPILSIVISQGGIDYESAQYYDQRTKTHVLLTDLIQSPHHEACFAIEAMIQGLLYDTVAEATGLPTNITSIIMEYASIPSKKLLHTIMRACQRDNKNDIDDIQKFLRADADPNACFYNNKTGLMYAAQAGKLDIVQLLIAERNINQLACDNHTMTALMYAAEQGHEKIVKCLLTQDMPADHKSWLLNLGSNPMSAPSAYHRRFMVTKPIRYNRTKDSIHFVHEERGNTALMLAAKNGHDDIVELLLKHGADRNKQNVRRKTALELAREGRERHQQSPEAQLRYDAVIKLLQG